MRSTSRKTGNGQLIVAATLLPGLAAVAVPALADADGQSASSAGQIEEVLVTANKRSENMQRVPISITAITADTADKVGVVNGQTLSEVVPGLQMNRQTNGSTPFLRGVGSPSTQAGTEPAVALYVDDVYYGSSAVQLGNYNNIQRIEVLKGPQGTLFGRNATGGVIQVSTKNPSSESHVDVSAGYANYKTYSGSLYATGGLAENVSANLSMYGEKQNDGWGTNFTLGIPTYLSHSYGGRAKLLWDVSSKTSVLFNVDYDNYFNQQAVYFRPAPGTRSNAGNSSIPPANVYDTIENIDPTAADEQYGGSIKVNHEFDAANLVSITAYRHSLATQQFDQDGSSVFRLDPLLIYTNKTWTQEFQLISPTSSKIAWVGGLYFLKDTVTVSPFQFNGALAGGGLSAKGAFATQDTKSYSGFFQAIAPINDKANVTAGVRYTSDKRSIDGGRINTSSTGVVSPQVFALNTGLSETWGNVTSRLAFDYQFTPDLMAYIAWNRGFKSGVFNTILAPSFAPPTLANPIPIPSNVGLNIDPPAAPEKLDSYTIGLKSELLDRKLRINVEGFYYKYKNLQLQSVVIIPGGGTTTRITNAATATLKGVDIDITWKPVERLTFNLGLEGMDGKYDDFPNGQFFFYNAAVGGNCALTPNSPVASACAAFLAGGRPPNYVPNADPTQVGTWNLAGNKTLQTPPFSANLTGTYTIPFSSGSLDLSANYYHSGNYYADADNGLGQVAPSRQANDHQDLVDIVNASLTWNAKDDKWSARLWGKNLGGTKYWSFANETGTIIKNTPAPPRTYGVTFTAHF